MSGRPRTTYSRGKKRPLNEVHWIIGGVRGNTTNNNIQNVAGNPATVLTTADADAGSSGNLAVVAVGSNVNQRIGNQIRLLSFELKGQFVKSALDPTATAWDGTNAQQDNNPIVINCWLILSKNNQKISPLDPTRVVSLVTGYLSDPIRNPNFAKEFKVKFSKRFVGRPDVLQYIVDAADANKIKAIGGGACILIDEYIDFTRKKNDWVVKFDGTGTTLGDIVENAPMLLVWSNGNPTTGYTTPWTFHGTYKLRFTD